MTDEQLVAVIQTEEDAKLAFEGNASVREEFTSAEAVWAYTKAIRAGRVRVAGRGRVGAGTK